MIKLRDTVISNVPPDKYHVWVKPNNGKYEMYIFSTSKGVWVRISGTGGGSGSETEMMDYLRQELEKEKIKYETLVSEIKESDIILKYNQVKNGYTVVAGDRYKYMTKVVIKPNPDVMTAPSFVDYTIPEKSTYKTGTQKTITVTTKINKGWNDWEDIRVIPVVGGTFQSPLTAGNDGVYTFTTTIADTTKIRLDIQYKYDGEERTAKKGTEVTYTFGLSLYYGTFTDTSYPSDFTATEIKKLGSVIVQSASLAATYLGADGTDYYPCFAVPSQYNCNESNIQVYSLSQWNNGAAHFVSKILIDEVKYDVFTISKGDALTKRFQFKIA